MGHYYRCLKCFEDIWLVGNEVSGKNEAVVKMREGKAINPGAELTEFWRKHNRCVIGKGGWTLRALEQYRTGGND